MYARVGGRLTARLGRTRPGATAEGRVEELGGISLVFELAFGEGLMR